MLHYQPWFTLLIVALGNCGFWLFWFNRINAIGLPRRTTKRIELGIVGICFLIPLAIATVEWKPLWAWLGTTHWWPQNAPLTQIWGAWCCASCLVMGSLWLESRRWLWPPRHLLASERKLFDVNRILEGGSATDRSTARLARLPGNQICQIDVTRKEIGLQRPITGADGLRIGHISDLHFTGKYSQQHYRFVIDRLLELEPQFVLITGDIIDYPEYLGWIDEVLGNLRAPLGCFFVLGNHDQRLPDVQPLLDALQRLGHHDLGQQDYRLELPSGLVVELTGNENPWFERHVAVTPQAEADLDAGVSGNKLRLGLSHTPDQIRWARRQRLDLLFAGHTHGGQFRPPGIGPILSPSIYGSKFASGLFYLEPTLMHVSRGVSGTHPFRWWCPPEITLLTLRNDA